MAAVTISCMRWSNSEELLTVMPSSMVSMAESEVTVEVGVVFEVLAVAGVCWEVAGIDIDAGPNGMGELSSGS